MDTQVVTPGAVLPVSCAEAVTLRDGTVLAIRAIQPADSAALQRFHSRLSAHSIYLRFFYCVPVLTAEQADHFTHVDGAARAALVALDPAAPDEIVGVVRYDCEPDSARAEYAIIVEDRWQGRGLGALLTRELVRQARAQGIRDLYAFVLPENRRMLHVFRATGLPQHGGLAEGVVRLDLDLGVMSAE